MTPTPNDPLATILEDLEKRYLDHDYDVDWLIDSVKVATRTVTLNEVKILIERELEVKVGVFQNKQRPTQFAFMVSQIGSQHHVFNGKDWKFLEDKEIERLEDIKKVILKELEVLGTK